MSRPIIAPPGRARRRREGCAGADSSRPIVAPPGRARRRRIGSFALNAGTCPYCAGPLTVANFSIDHYNPISRHRDFSIGNITVCDLRCNKIKGNLTSHDFLHFAAFLAQFPPEGGKNVLARLYAGGRLMRRP